MGLELHHLAWPFFNDAHHQLAEALEEWLPPVVKEMDLSGEDDPEGATRRWVRRLGEGGWLRYCVPGEAGGAYVGLDVRSLCLVREILARWSGLADFAFAMQGLGSGPISLFGSRDLRQRYLPEVATGKRIAAFALSEPGAGSDVGGICTTARRNGNGYILNGTKKWISNAGLADFYMVFARTGEGRHDLSAFVVDAETAGLHVAERIRVSAPHPLGTLVLEECRVPLHQRLGEEGQGYEIALATLDVFRTTVGAAALGFARRALEEALRHVQGRVAFGQPLARFQLVRQKVAEMALEVDASALLVYRAAWVRDVQGLRGTCEASMAKWFATEAAQRVVDRAVQLLGALGVVWGNPVERLYREVRALRIYEGTTEIQTLVVAEHVLRRGDAQHLDP